MTTVPTAVTEAIAWIVLSRFPLNEIQGYDDQETQTKRS
jgi:hypothetical protein